MNFGLKKIKISLFILTAILFILCSFVFFRQFSQLNFVNFLFSTSWLIQVLVVLSLNFNPRLFKWIIPLTLIISLCSYVNLSPEILVTSWKYQLTLYITILFGYWYLRFFSKKNFYLSIISCSLLIINLIYLCFIIYMHKSTQIYFDIAKWNTILIGVVGFFLGIVGYSKKLPKA
jgi:hypothetical protein